MNYPTNLDGYTVKQLKEIGLCWFKENKTISEMIAQANWQGNIGTLYTPFASKIYITRDGKLHANKPKVK